jgi:hypothetical protein
MSKQKITKETLPPIPKIENKYVTVIRHHGDLNKATTADGFEVYRTDYILFPKWSPFPVKCCPYSVHFIFDDPVAKDPIKGFGHYTPMCSCGSPGAIVGSNVYTKLMSPTYNGEMIICLTHMKTFIEAGIGYHADGVQE